MEKYLPFQAYNIYAELGSYTRTQHAHSAHGAQSEQRDFHIDRGLWAGLVSTVQRGGRVENWVVVIAVCSFKWVRSCAGF